MLGVVFGTHSLVCGSEVARMSGVRESGERPHSRVLVTERTDTIGARRGRISDRKFRLKCHVRPGLWSQRGVLGTNTYCARSRVGNEQ